MSNKSKSKRFGYVYILENPSIKGIKIGLTERHVHERVKELNRATGVPTPFNIYYYIDTKDCYLLEKRMHSHFAKKRVNNKREFFKLSPRKAKKILMKERNKIEGFYTPSNLSIFIFCSFLFFFSIFFYHYYQNDFNINLLIEQYENIYNKFLQRIKLFIG